MAVTVFYLTFPLYFWRIWLFWGTYVQPIPLSIYERCVFQTGIYIAVLVAIGYIIYQLQSVILPFLVAFILSYAINPLVQKLQDKAHIRRWVAILLVYLSTGLMIGLILWWLIPLVWEQLQSAWKYVPTAIDYYNNTLRGWVRSTRPYAYLPCKYVICQKAWSIFSKKTTISPMRAHFLPI